MRVMVTFSIQPEKGDALIKDGSTYLATNPATHRGNRTGRTRTLRP